MKNTIKTLQKYSITVTYHTYEPQDEVRMVWTNMEHANENNSAYVVMQVCGEDKWNVLLEADGMVAFHFEVWRGNVLIDTEPHFCHCLQYVANSINRFYCHWIPNVDNNNYRYTSAFTQCIYPFKLKDKALKKGKTVLMVQDFLCQQTEELFLVGSAESLGSWDAKKALPVPQVAHYAYAISLPKGVDGAEYKFVLRNKETGETIWEEGENRILSLQQSKQGEVNVLEQSPLRLPQRQDKLAGLVVPVFSLRTQKSWGVGDFGDLKEMVRWAAKTGMHVLQTLPINDTTRTGSWEDSYPYNAISIYALHPMYVDVHALGKLKDAKKQRQLEAERKKLNALPQVDYEAVNKLKNEFLWLYFLENENNLTYKEEPLLRPYYYFRLLQEEYGTADFRNWKTFATYDEAALKKYASKGKRKQKYAFYVWLQHVLVQQLEGVHAYAREKGVILKGDMPIGVSRNSATAWFYPDYFHFDGQAGAPPDYFSAKGQNWGFPTYNWDNILRDGGRWWKQRLGFMARFFDAYRIDHVLGFFRIWQIPYGTDDGRVGHFYPDLPMTEDEIRRNGFWKPMDECTTSTTEDVWNILFVQDAKIKTLYHPAVSAQSTEQYRNLNEGDRQAFDHIYYDYFYRRHNDFWSVQGMRRLPCAVYSTPMLVCAEDLGMIPDCVAGVLERFRILSLEVQTMPKRNNEGMFAWLPNNPFRSVDTITTHDMEPMRLWWQKYPDTAQQFFEQRLGGQGKAPEQLTPEWAEKIIIQHLESPSLLCIIALQDWLATDAALCNPNVEMEQVNMPANPRHYWRYRMHLNIEALMKATEYNEHLKQLTAR